MSYYLQTAIIKGFRVYNFQHTPQDILIEYLKKYVGTPLDKLPIVIQIACYSNWLQYDFLADESSLINNMDMTAFADFLSEASFFPNIPMRTVLINNPDDNNYFYFGNIIQVTEDITETNLEAIMNEHEEKDFVDEFLNELQEMLSQFNVEYETGTFLVQYYV